MTIVPRTIAGLSESWCSTFPGGEDGACCRRLWLFAAGVGHSADESLHALLGKNGPAGRFHQLCGDTTTYAPICRKTVVSDCPNKRGQWPERPSAT
jgi:hypothetical protein